ncbi:hypothetical protein B0H66DRAFT_568361 [Apodospora peruviana]|uniref:Uncharacterized protein n=1 Tax=Apodospora peruviana TaxID=516989 RepID=A0AAE0HWX7_9PEZI|nr:hypothetical protein B0H66DRAFT_568361 [Apodospora peruviana]
MNRRTESIAASEATTLKGSDQQTLNRTESVSSQLSSSSTAAAKYGNKKQSESGPSEPPPAGEEGRQQYVYYKKNKKRPQPDTAPKEMSRLSKFMSKFQSPAVKATKSIREREEEEDRRLGITRTEVTDVGRSSNAWALS